MVEGAWMDVMVERDICEPMQGISIRMIWAGGGSSWCASQELYMMANVLAS